MTNRKKLQAIDDQFSLEDVGSTLLEDLAKGLYEPDEVIREYIQNAVDAHRLYLNLTGSQPDGSIQIEMRENIINIMDYGIGMDFEEIKRVKSIAVSRKRSADIRLTGHKGVGIWAGLSFFENLRIYSTARGSNRGYELRIDFNGIVQGINDERNIGEVLNPNYSIEEYEEDEGEHYTIVTLENPVRSPEWFSDEDKIREAIRRICPCQIDPTFVYSGEVNNWYQKHGFETFPIQLNGQTIYRLFPSAVEKFEESSITINDQEVAYYWRAVHKDNGKISPNQGQIVGFNLIQDGFILGRSNPYSTNDDKSYEPIKLVQNYLNWYIGEIHIVDSGLRPNLRRNAFEESEDTRRFVKQLRIWYEDLDRSTRVLSYFRTRMKKYNEIEGFITRLSKTPMLWEDENDARKLLSYEADLQDDENIAQQSRSRRADNKSVHPHDKEALSSKELRTQRKRLLLQISDLRKREGVSKFPVERTQSEIYSENPTPGSDLSDEETESTHFSSPTLNSLAVDESDAYPWTDTDKDVANEDPDKNTLLEIAISLLEHILSEENLPQNIQTSIVKKLRERLLVVVGNEQESLS